MTNWDRREADILADAIAKHCRKQPSQTLENNLLLAIRGKVNQASQTVNTTFAELSFVRSQTCAVCRQYQLYECDVPQGWSKNCEFIRVNTTEFGSL